MLNSCRVCHCFLALDGKYLILSRLNSPKPTIKPAGGRPGARAAMLNLQRLFWSKEIQPKPERRAIIDPLDSPDAVALRTESDQENRETQTRPDSARNTMKVFVSHNLQGLSEICLIFQQSPKDKRNI